MFNAFAIFLVVKLGGPVSIVTFDTHPLIVYLSANGKGVLVVRIILVPTARPVACFALDTPEFRCDLFRHKTLRSAIAGSMAFQAVGVVLHPSEASKGVGMGVFFPFLEVLEMTKPAFPVANIVRLFLSQDVITGDREEGGKTWLECQGKKSNDIDNGHIPAHFSHVKA